MVMVMATVLAFLVVMCAGCECQRGTAAEAEDKKNENRNRKQDSSLAGWAIGTFYTSLSPTNTLTHRLRKTAQEQTAHLYHICTPFNSCAYLQQSLCVAPLKLRVLESLQSLGNVRHVFLLAHIMYTYLFCSVLCIASP